MDQAELKGFLAPIEERCRAPGGWSFEALEQEGVLEPLLAFIKSNPDLSQFEGHNQVIAGHSKEMTHLDLVKWLIARSASRGHQVAAQDLDKYLRTKNATFRIAAALTGVSVAGPVELGEGVSLVPSDEREFLGNAGFSRRFQVPDFQWSRPTAGITAALVRLTSVSWRHEPVAERSDRLRVQREREIQKAYIECARLCVGLVRPMPTSIVSWSMSSGDDVPFGTWYGGHPEDSPLNVGTNQLTEEEGLLARQLFEQILQIETKRQDRLLVAMERLDLAMRGLTSQKPASTVNAAIDLGIALEALLVADGPGGEIKHKLSLRGARLLGDTPGKRSQIMRRLGWLYDLRSTAAHTGTLPDKYKRFRTHQLLFLGTRAASDGIKAAILAEPRLLLHDDFNWHAILLA